MQQKTINTGGKGMLFFAFFFAFLFGFSSFAKAACTEHNMSYGNAVNSAIDITDCETSPNGPGYFSEMVSFAAVNGDEIIAGAHWDSFNGALILTDEYDNSITYNDDYYDILNNSYYTERSEIQAIIPTDGTYHLWLTSLYPGDSGSYSFSLIRAVDSPYYFSFSEQWDVDTGAMISSDDVTLNNFPGTLTATCNSGCLDIARNGVWSGMTTLAGFEQGDTIAIRQTASSNYSTMTTASVTVGTQESSQWRITTKANEANHFSFSDIANQPINTLVTSEVITISGFVGTLTASVTGDGGPKIEINNSGNWVTSGNIQSGQSLRVRLTSPSQINTNHLANIIINNRDTIWRVGTSRTRREYGWTNTLGSFGGMNSIESTFANSVAVDTSGAAYITGYFAGTVDFDPGVGTDEHMDAGESDIFLVKYAPDGTFQWVKTVGNDRLDRGDSVATDASGGVYVTGFFEGTVDFNPGTGTDVHASVGYFDFGNFLTKYASDGTYEWTKTFNGSEVYYPISVAVDVLGGVYVTGSFLGTADFDPGAGTDERTSNSLFDFFLTKYASDGTYEWTKTVGGDSDDWSNSVAADSSGGVYMTGYFRGTVDFDPGAGTDERTQNGFGPFLTKYASDGTYEWTKMIGARRPDWDFSDVATDSSGGVYVTGSFRGTIDFDPGAGTDQHASNGNDDSFLTKYASDGTYQ